MRYATPFAIAILAGAALPALAEEQDNHGVDVSTPDAPAVIETPAPPAPQPLCEIDPNNPMAGFKAKDRMVFIDAPDAEPVRATAPVEHWLAGRLSREETPAPLTKSFCQIGITDMVIDYHHPVINDDALIGIAYRTIYSWNPEDEFPGWQLTGIGERFECARGKDEETELCL
ncbi:MAG: hypothetical protein ACE37M_02700 [Henriciella sp.]